MYYYYYHAESDSLFKQLTELVPKSASDHLCEPIDEEMYNQLIKELGIMTDAYLAELLKVLKDISEVKGKGQAKKKAEILKENYSDDLELILKIAFDKTINTNIKSIKLHDKPVDTVYDFESLVQKITSVRALTKELRTSVEDFVNAQQMDKDLKKLLVKILTKKLSIGLAPKGINAALGKKLFDTTEYMKAEDDISIVKQWFDRGEEVVAEIKYDGIRCIATFENMNLVKLETYNRSVLDMVPLVNIVPQLNKFAERWPFDSSVSFFLDFEITNKKNRQDVSGEVNKVLKGTAKPDIDKNWVLNVFDVHSTDIVEDEEAVSRVNYKNRRKVLGYMMSEPLLPVDVPSIKIAQVVPVKNMEHVESLFAQVISKREEGLMLKKVFGVYEMKRSKNWVKMKSEKECELVVRSWFKGEGKRESTIGGFVFASSDNKVMVEVGGGFKDVDLQEIMKYGPDSYVGKVATIKYNEVITRKNSDVKSLFLPRFIVWRFDKDYADGVDKIK